MKNFMKKLMLSLGAIPATVLATVSFAFASSNTPTTPAAVSSSDIASVLTALQKQISVASVVEIIAYVIGAGIGLVFMWWAARKLIKTFMGAFRSGRLGS